MATHRAIAGWAPIEVAEALDAYARSRGMKPSQAVVVLLAKGLRLPAPKVRSVGRPAKSPVK